MHCVVRVKRGVAYRVVVSIDHETVPLRRIGRGELPVDSGVAQRDRAESHLRHPEITLHRGLSVRQTGSERYRCGRVHNSAEVTRRGVVAYLVLQQHIKGREILGDCVSDHATA